MNKLFNKLFVALVLCALSFGVYANSNREFCNGYVVGYKTAKGSNNVAAPACPAMPAIPSGSSAYQEGLKQGMKDGSR